MTKNDLRVTKQQRQKIRREVTALSEVLDALTPLGFDERRRLLRWACDYYGIDPTKLSKPSD